MLPELDEFTRRLRELARHPSLRPLIDEDQVSLGRLALAAVDELLRDDVAWYFLLSAAGLNRTSLRVASSTDPEAQIAAPRLRRAHAVRARLPVNASFTGLVDRAATLRAGDLQRKARGQSEQFFRERLAEEGIPLLMSPPRIVVPGVLIAGRKPDGVWPDPRTGRPPEVYLEIKRIRRVADDIQKRLYELAEASLEMKLLYSGVRLTGLELDRAGFDDVGAVAARLRHQLVGARPAVIGLLLCPTEQASRYRVGAEALIDHVFFQEEIDECIALLKALIVDTSGLTPED